MLSRFVLRKPTTSQTWHRVQRDRETGILSHAGTITRDPTPDELETWAILIGHDPRTYLTAWASEAAEPRGQTLLSLPSTEEEGAPRAECSSRFNWRGLASRLWLRGRRFISDWPRFPAAWRSQRYGRVAARKTERRLPR